MSAILEVRDLSVAYGAIKAIKSVSLTLARDEIVTLIREAGFTPVQRTTEYRILKIYSIGSTGGIAGISFRAWASE